MATIIPGSELARKALAWISEHRPAASGGGDALCKLLDEAAMRFNLGPLDVEFLERMLRQGDAKADEE